MLSCRPLYQRGPLLANVPCIAKTMPNFEIVELLGETNLLGTALKLPTFMSQIILEFYVNLSKDMGNQTSPNFQKMMVRGHTFDFSHSIINQYWECTDVLEEEEEVLKIDPMVLVIIGGKVRSYKIDMCNWLPTPTTQLYQRPLLPCSSK